MSKLPKYICMKVSLKDDLTVCLDPVDPEEVAADVRSEPSARWIDFEDGSMCSRCGASHDGVNRNYCPNCGERMKV